MDYAYDALGRRLHKNSSAHYKQRPEAGSQWNSNEHARKQREYQCDHLGTPQELTDQNGDIAWSAQYKAWGEVREQRSALAQQQGLRNPIRFQGQYHDHETGLHYNRHRYYDPSVGRFISKDPIGNAGGLNLYEYAPNPIGWVDPLGLAKFGTGKGTHTAEVIVHDVSGEQTIVCTLHSGNMTPEEKALGFPRSSLATHTEARAVKQIPLAPGDVMVINGQYPPCPSCKGKMNKAAASSGADIQYTWPENGEIQTWNAKSKGARRG